MKRIFTLCVFTIALLSANVGIAQVKAENIKKDAELASLVEEAKSLASEIGLNDNQLNAFTRAYVAREQSIKSGQNPTVQQKDSRKMNDKKFIAQMTESMSPAQLEKFKAVYKKKMQSRQ